jgi:hypothetical protein
LLLASLCGHTIFAIFRDKADAVPFSIRRKSNGMDNVHSFSDIKRVYRPEDLRVMAAAYDRGYDRLPKEFRVNGRAARKLALLIIRGVDRGLHDPESLADLAMLEFYR